MLAALSVPDSIIEATASIAAPRVGAPIDPNGNLTNDGLTSYTWNARDQLAGLSGGTSASFQYDGIGRRRGKTVSGTSTNFLYDQATLVQELTSGGTPTANVLTGLGIDETFTRTDAGGTSTLLVDALGSTLELADTSGTLQTHYTYEPFGATMVSGATSTNATQFTGRENDGTGLYYYRFRYYDSGRQRFLSEDLLGRSGGADLYTYANNNPVLFVDPLGLQSSRKDDDCEPCRQKCWERYKQMLVPCLGVGIPAGLASCALACTPTLLLGPGAYGLCMGRCLALAGGAVGVCTAVVTYRYYECLKECPPCKNKC